MQINRCLLHKVSLFIPHSIEVMSDGHTDNHNRNGKNYNYNEIIAVINFDTVANYFCSNV